METYSLIVTIWTLITSALLYVYYLKNDELKKAAEVLRSNSDRTTAEIVRRQVLIDEYRAELAKAPQFVNRERISSSKRADKTVDILYVPGQEPAAFTDGVMASARKLYKTLVAGNQIHE